MDREKAQQCSDALWAVKYQEPKVAEMKRLLALFDSGENDVTITISWSKKKKDGESVNLTNRERKKMDVGKDVIRALIVAELDDEAAKLQTLEKALEAI